MAGACATGLIFSLLLTVTWVGFLESDDLEYAYVAQSWVAAPPFLAQSHWGLRHLIVLPMAAGFALFGTSETTLVLPATLYGTAIVAMTGLCLARLAGPLAGLLAALLVATLPVVVSGSTMVFSDICEAFFVLASLWAYLFARRGGSAWLYAASGALAGAGFITRETTVALLALYLVLFLIAPRRILDFARMAAGFLAVVGLDMALLWAASGDPLWRLTIAQRGVAGDNPALTQFQQNIGGLDRHGVIIAPRAVQALLAVFVHQASGLVAWAAVPAAVALAWAGRSATRPPAPGRDVALHFAGLALVWFALLSYVFLFLWIIPRYQTVTFVALCVPLAVWLAARIAAGARVLPALVLLALAGSGSALALLGDREQMFGERGLVAFARATTGPIRTDPMTLRGADWMLRAAGLRDRVSAGPCEPGGLCYANPRPRRGLPPGVAAQPVPAAAETILEVNRRRSPAGQLLGPTGLLGLLPPALRTKFDPPPMAARGFRMPG